MFGIALTLQAQEYSADLITRPSNGTAQKGKLYHTANKDRFDSFVDTPQYLRAPGEKPVPAETRMITDRQQKLIYLVEPQQKLILVNYALQMKKDPPAGNSGGNPCDDFAKVLGPTLGSNGCKQVGPETVSGRSAVKWEMQIRTLTGQAGTGTVWVDSQLKTAIKWLSTSGDSGELQNIQVGPQPASLFVLPADYRRQDLPH